MEEIKLKRVESIPEKSIEGKNKRIIEKFLKMRIRFAETNLKLTSGINLVAKKHKFPVKAVSRQKLVYLTNLKKIV